MTLALASGAAQRRSLDAFLEAQQDPASPEYRLTPEAFGERFGASEKDVRRVVARLENHGFDVQPVTGARRQIIFNCTAAQVQSAFRTEVRLYNISGETRYADSSDPKIPNALGQVVRGAVSLHNSLAQPMMHRILRPVAARFPN